MNKVMAALVVVFGLAGCHTSTTERTALAGDTVAATGKGLVKTCQVDGIADKYLQLKDALAANDEELAKSKAQALLEAINNTDISGCNSSQQRAFNIDLADIKENATHISKSELYHQREHFETLSEEMYNIVQAINATQPMYLIECRKGKDVKMWLTNVIDHKNPYLGEAGIGCYALKEKIPGR